jgi:hypothetical protein
MKVLQILLLGVVFFSGLLLIIGLFSPTVVLWWMAYQNRIRVLKIYGSIFILSAMGYYLLFSSESVL